MLLFGAKSQKKSYLNIHKMDRDCIAALGDLSFHQIQNKNSCENVFDSVRKHWDGCELTIGNLETPLVREGQGVAGKCILASDPKWMKFLYDAGVMLVSLANNHIMDYGPEGLYDTIRVLEEVGIEYVGAGGDVTKAEASLYVDLNGRKVAFLARSAVVVSSPCYAGKEKAGVAYLDLSKTKDMIRDCKKHADKVVLLLHWGIEHYFYPSPAQRRLAGELIGAGADLIIGHHPHVLQGIERIGDGLVCYSLGNFLFDDVEWSFLDQDGQSKDRVIRLSEENRKGGILKVAFSENGVESYEFIPTHIEPDGTVRVENTIERQREFSRLSSRLYWPAYSLLWQLYSLRQEWKLRLKPMTIGRFKWANLKKVRPKHFREFWEGLRRSGKITSERSTNPYE